MAALTAVAAAEAEAVAAVAVAVAVAAEAEAEAEAAMEALLSSARPPSSVEVACIQVDGLLKGFAKGYYYRGSDCTEAQRDGPLVAKIPPNAEEPTSRPSG